MMWTGSAYREFAVWRERYPGGLTEVEGAFAAAMTSFATRRRRRRRIAAAAVLTIAVVVAAGFATLWRRSVLETRRAEAAKLLALAQVQLDTDPTQALSYTTASLEVADSEEARVFALRLLWEGPHALELAPEGSGASPRIPVFSPDGSRLAAPGHSAEVRVWTAKGGDPPLVLPGHTPSPQGPNRARWASDELLLTGHWTDGRVRAWAIPGGRLVRTIDFGGPAGWWVHGETLFAPVKENDAETGHVISHLFSWRLPDGEREALGSIDRTALGSTFSRFDRDGRGLFYGKGNEIFYRPLPGGEGVPDRLVGSHDNEAASGLTRTEYGRLWTRDAGTGEMRQWDLTQGEPILTAVIPALESAPEGRLPDPSGRWVRDRDLSGRQARVWDREAWSEARPLTLRRSGSWYGAVSGFHPAGDWLVVSTHNFVDLTFWPLRGAWPRVVDGYSGLFRPLAFSADGRWLATSWSGRFLRLWPLPDRGSGEVKVSEFSEEVRAAAGSWRNLAFDPGGRYVFVVGDGNKNWLVPLDGSLPRKLESFSDDTFLGGAAVSPSGRQVATAFLFGGGPKTLRVWDVETGELRLFDLPDGSSSKTGYERGIVSLGFADESTLYTGGDGGVRRWNLENGEHELVLGVEPGRRAGLALGADGRKALVWETVFLSRERRPAKILDLATAESRELPAFGQVHSRNLALDSTGKVAVTGDEEGIIRVGYVTCDEPHLLVGHEGPIDRVAISPDLRWVASTGEDNTLRLWPMPDLDKPPLHTLPHDELIAKLHTLTNLRAVRDAEAPSGWKLEVSPFPGWAEVPTW
jgi:WD40 repeat protein